MAAALIQWLYVTPHLHLIGRIPAYTYATYPVVAITTVVMLGTMRARQQYTLWNLCRASIPAAYLLLVLGLLAAHRLTAGSVLMVLFAANVLLLFYLASRLILERHLRFVPNHSKALLRLGIQHYLISIGQLVNQRIDQFVLVGLVSAPQLGYYSVAVTYSSIALTVALAPAWHLFSQASTSGQITPQRFRWLQRRTTTVMIGVAVIGGVCAPVFITLAFGHAYAPAILPAVILVAGGPPLALSALRAAVWKASGKPLPAALAEGIGVVVTVVGLSVFAPRFGIIAAACTSVIAYTSVTIVLFRLGTAPVVSLQPGVARASTSGEVVPPPGVGADSGSLL